MWANATGDGENVRTTESDPGIEAPVFKSSNTQYNHSYDALTIKSPTIRVSK